MKQLTMQGSHPYHIRIQNGLLADTVAQIADAARQSSLGIPDKLGLICDSTVYSLYAKPDQPLCKSLQSAGMRLYIFSFPAGEQSKTLSTAERILDFLGDNGFTRKDMLLALGGGVTGDLTGFSASLYMRGIRYIQLPTTLLAMADSSIGGKTGVNTKLGKNLTGTFWHPELVLMDPNVLHTLSEPQFQEGLAEIIKAAFIGDLSVLDPIPDTIPESASSHPMEALSAALIKALEIKKAIVESDERESGRRRLLNFGHTIGHAIETCSAYRISHGHAVMTGMYLTALASEKLGWSEKPSSEYLAETMDRFRFPVCADFASADLVAAALHDKKCQGDYIPVVFPVRPGHCALRNLPVMQLERFIRAGMESMKSKK